MKLLNSILLLIVLIGIAHAADCAYYFYGIGCPHCARADPVIKGLEVSGVEIHRFEVYQNSSNALLLNLFFDANNVSQRNMGVPALFYSGGYMFGDRAIIDNAPYVLSYNGSQPCPLAGEIGGMAISSEASPAVKMSFTELVLFAGGAALVDTDADRPPQPPAHRRR